MSKIFLVSPCFCSDVREEKKRQKELRKWFFEEEQIKKLEELGFSIDDLEPYFVGRQDSTEIANIRKEYVDIVQKGTAIRDKISTIVDEEQTLTGHYFIMFDGDGQIPKESFFTILEELLDKEKHVVFACRADKPGIKIERAVIEDFELYLLTVKYGVYLPDGQCGCWGFKTSILKEIRQLTAKGFEIELDLLTSCLKHPTFIPSFFYVPISYVGESQFRSKDHERKLYFLADHLQLSKDFVLGKYQEFKKQFKKQPSFDYEELIRGMDWPLIEDDSDKLEHIIPSKMIIPRCSGGCKVECKCSDVIEVR